MAGVETKLHLILALDGGQSSEEKYEIIISLNIHAMKLKTLDKFLIEFVSKENTGMPTTAL
jgi:hypothetical protein